jgi:hypothetical protein
MHRRDNPQALRCSADWNHSGPRFLVGRPRIVTRGFVFASNAEHLPTQAGELVRSTAAVKRGTAPGNVEAKIETALSSLIGKPSADQW